MIGITANALTFKSALNEHYIEEISRPKFERYLNIYMEPIFSLFNPVRPYELYALLSNNSSVSLVETFHNDGWVESYNSNPDSMYALDDYNVNFKNNKVSNELINQFLIQVKEWEENGIAVYGFIPPVPHKMREIENNAGFNEVQIVKQFIENGGNFISINPDEYESYDGSHIDGNYAKKLSAQLGQAIFENKEVN